jgi:type II protein arginine methyltransferase
MWRHTDDRKVWYEWLVEVFVCQDLAYASASAAGKRGGLDTSKGRRAKVGSSELHSSVKEACMM